MRLARKQTRALSGTTFARCSLAQVARFSLAIPHPPTRVIRTPVVLLRTPRTRARSLGGPPDARSPARPRFARLRSRARSRRPDLARCARFARLRRRAPASSAEFQLPRPFGWLRVGPRHSPLYAPLRSDWPTSTSLLSTTLVSQPSLTGSAFGPPCRRHLLSLACEA